MIDTQPTAVVQLKSELVETAEAVSRGLDETPEQREAITALVEKLEKRNPTKRWVRTTTRRGMGFMVDS